MIEEEEEGEEQKQWARRNLSRTEEECLVFLFWGEERRTLCAGCVVLHRSSGVADGEEEEDPRLLRVCACVNVHRLSLCARAGHVTVLLK